ncbi:hypothetical protein M9H77_08466 [Catharanthus roseus]|uniref:Uncharacterized protein n=1 Tax=Catharanthus roseus TaxID=4058 RepID=A0ACC0BY91_CATRO|nr:hypothetical protein M9H77_08466 [Catharanthus roseus]
MNMNENEADDVNDEDLPPEANLSSAVGLDVKKVSIDRTLPQTEDFLFHDSIRIAAAQRDELYKRVATQYRNARIRPSKIQARDCVLRHDIQLPRTLPDSATKTNASSEPGMLQQSYQKHPQQIQLPVELAVFTVVQFSENWSIFCIAYYSYHGSEAALCWKQPTLLTPDQLAQSWMTRIGFKTGGTSRTCSGNTGSLIVYRRKGEKLGGMPKRDRHATRSRTRKSPIVRCTLSTFATRFRMIPCIMGADNSRTLVHLHGLHELLAYLVERVARSFPLRLQHKSTNRVASVV